MCYANHRPMGLEATVAPLSGLLVLPILLPWEGPSLFCEFTSTQSIFQYAKLELGVQWIGWLEFECSFCPINASDEFLWRKLLFLSENKTLSPIYNSFPIFRGRIWDLMQSNSSFIHNVIIRPRFDLNSVLSKLD